jgi:hypothetical protein
MPKLSQVLGPEKSTRSRVNREVTKLHRRLQMPDLFDGFTRTYNPKDDDGEELPPETKRVQAKVEEVLAAFRRLETEQFDVVATKEWGNCEAKASVEVDGVTILDDVPVGYLLFLEKRLNDIFTFFQTLPILDPNETWELDQSDGLQRSDAVETLKMRKVPRNHVKAAATEHHPAQVETYYEDEPVGRWTRVRRSGAVPPVRVDDLCRKTIKLRDAVISARAVANTIDVEEMKVGAAVFNFILGS